MEQGVQRPGASRSSTTSSHGADDSARKERTRNRAEEEQAAKSKARSGGSRSPMRSGVQRPGAPYSREDQKTSISQASSARPTSQDNSVDEETGGYGDGVAVAAVLIDEESEEEERMKKLQEMETRLNQQMQSLQQQQQQGTVIAQADEGDSEDGGGCNKRFLYVVGALAVAAIGIGAYFGTRPSGSETENSGAVAATNASKATDIPVLVSTDPPSMASVPTSNPNAKPVDAVTDVPTGAPSMVPPKFAPPTPETCDAIANGDVVTGQNKMETKTFKIELDLTLASSSETSNLQPLLDSLKVKFQELLVPKLAGCLDNTRQLAVGENSVSILQDGRKLDDTKRYSIANGLVDSISSPVGRECGSSSLCFPIIVELRLFLKEELDNSILIPIITDVFGDSLVTDLELTSSVAKLHTSNVIEELVATQTPTPGPSVSLTTQAPTVTSENSRRPQLFALLSPHFPLEEQAFDWLVDEDTWVSPSGASANLWEERYAAAVLYYSLDGPNWNESNDWLSSNPICDWQGLECDNSQVSWMALIGNGLDGRIPSEIGLFTNMRGIELDENSLFGTIPTELAAMTLLTSLHTPNNALTGIIPPLPSGLVECNLSYGNVFFDISNAGVCSKEIFLETLGNEFNWDARHWIANKDTWFATTGSGSDDWSLYMERYAAAVLYYSLDGPNWDASNNWLSSNPVCDWEGIQCDGSEVVWLDLMNNGLVGTIPTEIGIFTNMGQIELDDNNLFGPIPAEMAALTLLTDLHLPGNQLTGSIPPLPNSLLQGGRCNLCCGNSFGNTLNVAGGCDFVD